jgi:hypothetical protein
LGGERLQNQIECLLEEMRIKLSIVVCHAANVRRAREESQQRNARGTETTGGFYARCGSGKHAD